LTKEAPAIMTTLDGYQMALQGRAPGVGDFGVWVLHRQSPRHPDAHVFEQTPGKLALNFGPTDYFKPEGGVSAEVQDEPSFNPACSAVPFSSFSIPIDFSTSSQTVVNIFWDLQRGQSSALKTTMQLS
jgi:hypothetical protein